MDYCTYDCSSGANLEGILCSCTSNDQRLDPFLLHDLVGSCMNSALLDIHQAEFTLVVTKDRTPSSLSFTFGNAGDRILD